MSDYSIWHLHLHLLMRNSPSNPNSALQVAHTNTYLELKTQQQKKRELRVPRITKQQEILAMASYLHEKYSRNVAFTIRAMLVTKDSADAFLGTKSPRTVTLC